MVAVGSKLPASSLVLTEENILVAMVFPLITEIWDPHWNVPSSLPSGPRGSHLKGQPWVCLANWGALLATDLSLSSPFGVGLNT